jgi:rare lipoprotein A
MRFVFVIFGAAFALCVFMAFRLSAETVTASWYGPGFHGRLTANGERYDMNGMTCAHKTLKFGTRLRLTRGDKSAVCRVNDRGPYIAGRSLDVSRAVASALGMLRSGVAIVRMEKIP